MSFGKISFWEILEADVKHKEAQQKKKRQQWDIYKTRVSISFESEARIAPRLLQANTRPGTQENSAIPMNDVKSLLQTTDESFPSVDALERSKLSKYTNSEAFKSKGKGFLFN